MLDVESLCQSPVVMSTRLPREVSEGSAREREIKNVSDVDICDIMGRI